MRITLGFWNFSNSVCQRYTSDHINFLLHIDGSRDDDGDVNVCDGRIDVTDRRLPTVCRVQRQVCRVRGGCRLSGCTQSIDLPPANGRASRAWWTARLLLALELTLRSRCPVHGSSCWAACPHRSAPTPSATSKLRQHSGTCELYYYF